MGAREINIIRLMISWGGLRGFWVAGFAPSGDWLGQAGASLAGWAAEYHISDAPIGADFPFFHAQAADELVGGRARNVGGDISPSEAIKSRQPVGKPCHLSGQFFFSYRCHPLERVFYFRFISLQNGRGDVRSARSTPRSAWARWSDANATLGSRRSLVRVWFFCFNPRPARLKSIETFHSKRRSSCRSSLEIVENL